MKKFILLFLVILVAGFSVSCRKHDIRTMWIKVPEMKNQACADRIKEALANVSGVEADMTEFNLSNRTVLVSYESTLLSMKNIEFYISEAGFSANEIPADKKARSLLPDECK